MHAECLNIYFPKSGSVGVMHLCTSIQCTNLLHFILGQYEVKNLHIPLDTGSLRGTRKYDNDLLIDEAQDDLPRIFSILLCSAVITGSCSILSITAPERRPCFHFCPCRRDDLPQFFLLKVRIELDLIDSGLAVKLWHITQDIEYYQAIFSMQISTTSQRLPSSTVPIASSSTVRTIATIVHLNPPPQNLVASIPPTSTQRRRSRSFGGCAKLHTYEPDILTAKFELAI